MFCCGSIYPLSFLLTQELKNHIIFAVGDVKQLIGNVIIVMLEVVASMGVSGRGAFICELGSWTLSISPACRRKKVFEAVYGSDEDVFFSSGGELGGQVSVDVDTRSCVEDI
ncbi:hypothetical protein E2C01_097968 [Portunus trituberculatus]|uniref:Uncharacterized protein n=1 Tax=Portunus trituberculatus TaxID=210409 RepID=A0A5B7K5S1_PORTR|nr:hypothetical protein [Portunus trituberculatus]